MTLQDIKACMESRLAILPEERLQGWPTVIGYERRLIEMNGSQSIAFAQIDAYFVAVDLRDTSVTVAITRQLLDASHALARAKFKQDYPGWTWVRHLAALGVVTIVVSRSVERATIKYCQHLKRRSGWLRFKVPVVVDSSTGQIYSFKRGPIWGRMFYRYLKGLTRDVVPPPGPASGSVDDSLAQRGFLRRGAL